VFFIVTVALNEAPPTTEGGTDWLTSVAPLASAAVVGVGVGVRVDVGVGVRVGVPVGAEVCVRVGVGVIVGVGVGVLVAPEVGVRVDVTVSAGVTVGVLVGVFVGVGVGVLVGVLVGVDVVPRGVTVGVHVGVMLGVFVGVGVTVGVGVGDGVGVGVEPVPTDTVTTALLFDMSGSPWFPITPATTSRFPICRGVTTIATLVEPVVGHITVVEGSLPPGTRRQAPAVELPELIVTAGEKIAVTHTPLPPAVFTRIEKLPAIPTAGLDGGTMPVTDRSGRAWPASTPVSDSVAGTPSRRIRRNHPESIFRLPFFRSLFRRRTHSS
jgi:hypothetical protein